jgi:hypothetical protein
MDVEMNHVRVGNWFLSLPDDLVFDDNNRTPHFKSADGRIEVFVKSVKIASTRTAEATANYIQNIHESSLRELPGYEWQAEIKTCTVGEGYKSLLELYDPHKQYYVASSVVSKSDEAVQVTVHDYLCISPEKSKTICSLIVNSIKKA